MADNSGLLALVDSLESRASALESKMDELYMRPRMPYTQNALQGDILKLDGDLIPQWTTPGSSP